MSPSSAVNGHLDLIGEFRRRFPLFDRIVGQFGDETPTERIPWFFGFLLAAAARPEPGACCFVLDKTPGTTAIPRIAGDDPPTRRAAPAISMGLYQCSLV